MNLPFNLLKIFLFQIKIVQHYIIEHHTLCFFFDATRSLPGFAVLVVVVDVLVDVEVDVVLVVDVVVDVVVGVSVVVVVVVEVVGGVVDVVVVVGVEVVDVEVLDSVTMANAVDVVGGVAAEFAVFGAVVVSRVVVVPVDVVVDCVVVFWRAADDDVELVFKTVDFCVVIWLVGVIVVTKVFAVCAGAVDDETAAVVEAGPDEDGSFVDSEVTLFVL
jgi:hypothetical protein